MVALGNAFMSAAVAGAGQLLGASAYTGAAKTRRMKRERGRSQGEDIVRIMQTT
jgi:hypothetical protein